MATKPQTYTRATTVTQTVLVYSGIAVALHMLYALTSNTIWNTPYNLCIGALPAHLCARLKPAPTPAPPPDKPGEPWSNIWSIFSSSEPYLQHETRCSGIEGRRVPRVWHEGGCKGANGISITLATYGGNCGAPNGFGQGHIASACDGKTRCEYSIEYQVIGDPVVGCRKDYRVEYECGGKTRDAYLPGPLGWGEKISLDCD